MFLISPPSEKWVNLDWPIIQDKYINTIQTLSTGIYNRGPSPVEVNSDIWNKINAMYWHCVIAFLYLYFLFYISLSVCSDRPDTKLAVFQDLFQIQFHMYNKSLNILIGPKNEAFNNSTSTLSVTCKHHILQQS